MFPKECRYLETHEWARLGGDSIVTMGITDFAVEQLGDIVYIELPKTGDKATKGSALGMVESVKATSDFYAPVSGEVAEVNESLADNLEIFKTDAYGAAWLVKIKADNPAELDSLLNAKAYEKQLKEQQ